MCICVCVYIYTYIARNMYLRFSGCMDWWEDLLEPERTSRLALFVNGDRIIRKGL